LISPATGFTCEGHKEVLDLWIQQTVGAKFLMRMLNECRAGGINDVSVAVVDGLKGLAEAAAQALI